MTEPLQTRLDDCREELTRLRLLLGVELSIEPLRLEASYRKETRLRAQINATQQELDRLRAIRQGIVNRTAEQKKRTSCE
jgi:hypothetical protein